MRVLEKRRVRIFNRESRRVFGGGKYILRAGAE